MELTVQKCSVYRLYENLTRVHVVRHEKSQIWTISYVESNVYLHACYRNVGIFLEIGGFFSDRQRTRDNPSCKQHAVNGDM